ncbi:hypothetical protein GEMRC1_007636 [Eukaryota sp. GEM-RC1]
MGVLGKPASQSMLQQNNPADVKFPIRTGILLPPFGIMPSDQPTFYNPVLLATAKALRSSQVNDDRGSTVELPRDSHWLTPVSPLSLFSEFFGSLLTSKESVHCLQSPSAELDATLTEIDMTPAFEVHKAGLVYLKHGQTKSIDILSNSDPFLPSYTQFLAGLGRLVALEDCSGMFTGGLRTPEDGKFALVRLTPLSTIVFHVANLMPNNPHDVARAGKLRHIGNDYVIVCFCEPGAKASMNILNFGQFNSVFIIVTPVGNNFYRVEITSKPQLEPNLSFFSEFLSGSFILNSSSLVPFVAQVVSTCNRLCTLVFDSDRAACRPLLRTQKILKVSDEFKKTEITPANLFQFFSNTL